MRSVLVLLVLSAPIASAHVKEEASPPGPLRRYREAVRQVREDARAGRLPLRYGALGATVRVGAGLGAHAGFDPIVRVQDEHGWARYGMSLRLGGNVGVGLMGTLTAQGGAIDRVPPIFSGYRREGMSKSEDITMNGGFTEPNALALGFAAEFGHEAVTSRPYPLHMFAPSWVSAPERRRILERVARRVYGMGMGLGVFWNGSGWKLRTPFLPVKSRLLFSLDRADKLLEKASDAQRKGDQDALGLRLEQLNRVMDVIREQSRPLPDDSVVRQGAANKPSFGF